MASHAAGTGIDHELLAIS